MKKARAYSKTSKPATLPKRKRQKSIRTTLFTGFLLPVLMILILGIVSYLTASQIIKDKYEDSSLNTINAMSMYAETLTSGISSRALEQFGDDDLKQYYEVYYANTDENWLTYYTNAKNQLLHLCNSTDYIKNYYTIPEAGSILSSTKTEWRADVYANFMSSNIGQSFTANKSQKMVGLVTTLLLMLPIKAMDRNTPSPMYAVFGAIEEKVNVLINGLQLIVDGMGQINTDKSEIQMSVMNISMEAETAAASTQEVSATLDEQVGIIAKLAENMDHLKNETSILEQSINRFKIQ